MLLTASTITTDYQLNIAAPLETKMFALSLLSVEDLHPFNLLRHSFCLNNAMIALKNPE